MLSRTTPPEQLSPTLDNYSNEFWANFELYLKQNLSKKSVYDRLSYAKKYAYILRNESEVQDILQLSIDKRLHAMKALAVLSKYLGCYNQWKDIRERYQLKWSNGETGLEVFQNIMNAKNDYKAMMVWLSDACSKLPESYRAVLIYDTLTGLRPDEACQSVSLIHDDLRHYLNKDTNMLEHYKYAPIFLRRTKNAYISLSTEEILNIGSRQAGKHSYISIRMACEERGVPMKMKYCRSIFATYLRTKGVEQELIDLLQGRVPKSVFARHYFRPDFKKTCKRVRKLILKLHEEIS